METEAQMSRILKAMETVGQKVGEAGNLQDVGEEDEEMEEVEVEEDPSLKVTKCLNYGCGYDVPIVSSKSPKSIPWPLNHTTETVLDFVLKTGNKSYHSLISQCVYFSL